MKPVMAVLFGFLILMAGDRSASASTSYFDDDSIEVNDTSRVYDTSGVNDTSRVNDPLGVVNRPVNVQGLTGLVITNSAYTQRKGSIVAGFSAMNEKSSVPDFNVTQGIATITAGIADRIEIGIRAGMMANKPGGSSSSKTGIGDTDILFKWRVSSQGDSMPAIALGLAYTMPTGDEAKGFRTVKHEGIRLMLIGATEQEIVEDYLVGVYFEGQAVFIDKLEKSSSSNNADAYGIVNAGLLLPLLESRRLQAIVEYQQVVKKDIPTLVDQNHTAFMPGLRYVTPDFSISAGMQFLSKDQKGYDNDKRYIGTISYRF